jgi:hypothetical protein
MAHTPGPWAVGQTVNNFVQIVAPEYRTLTDADHVVCELRAWRRPTYIDNALLIASAPELLESLVAMRAAFTSDGTDAQHKACALADRVIKQAGGDE